MSYTASVSGSHPSTSRGGTSTSDSMGSEGDLSTTDTDHQTSAPSAALGEFADGASTEVADADASDSTEPSEFGLLAQQGAATLREMGKVTTPQQQLAQGHPSTEGFHVDASGPTPDQAAALDMADRVQPRSPVAVRGDSWAKMAGQGYGDERYALAFGNALWNSIAQGIASSGSQQAAKASQAQGTGLTFGASGGFGLKPSQQQVNSFGLNADDSFGAASAELNGPMPAVNQGPMLMGNQTVSAGKNGGGLLAVLGQNGYASQSDKMAAAGYLKVMGQWAPGGNVSGGQQFSIDRDMLEAGRPEFERIGREAVSGEGRQRAADERAMDIARIQTLTRYSQADRQADSNYQLVIASNSRIAAMAPASVDAAPRSSLTDNYDSVVMDTWSNFKAETRANLDQVGVSGGGGGFTVAAAGIHAASEIGYGLIDAGIGLGRVGARVYDSYSRRTLWTDFKGNLMDPTRSFTEAIFKTDTYRLSIGATLNNGDDVKFMIGTDRVGFQYKMTGIADSVNRTTYRWGASGWTDEMLVEKNFKFGDYNRLLPSMQIGGVPISIDVVPGARQNLTGNRIITPSMNVDFNIGKTDYIPYKFKFSLEFRKSGS